MADITYADTTTRDANTQKVLSILPPIQEAPAQQGERTVFLKPMLYKDLDEKIG